MFATYFIKTKRMNNSTKFDDNLQDLARFGKAISHPARLAILQYLAQTESCISGDISDQLPLSRTTVSQHLKELRDLGLIYGEIDGLKINYCLCSTDINKYLALFENFFGTIKNAKVSCSTNTSK
jgi:ArsR family transcriptional regulator, arsenate/arsenite/antimonite-responsive transcriptional repressor